MACVVPVSAFATTQGRLTSRGTRRTSEGVARTPESSRSRVMLKNGASEHEELRVP